MWEVVKGFPGGGERERYSAANSQRYRQWRIDGIEGSLGGYWESKRVRSEK